MAPVPPPAAQPPREDPPARLSEAKIPTLDSSINNLLLHCAVVLAGWSVGRSAGFAEAHALTIANEALALASRHCLFELVGKTFLFRGHCLRRMGRWHAAHEAYVRAASERAFAADTGAEDLEALTAECAARARASPVEDEEKEERRPMTGRGLAWWWG